MTMAIMRDAFTGIGKPEPLKYLSPGTWSRRMTQEHRISLETLELIFSRQSTIINQFSA